MVDAIDAQFELADLFDSLAPPLKLGDSIGVLIIRVGNDGSSMTNLITGIAKFGAGMMLISGSKIMLSALGLFLFFLYEILMAMAQYTRISSRGLYPR